MPAKLTLHPPKRASRFLVIRDGESLVVGRSPECGLVLEHPKVSSRHARLLWTGDSWALEDLRSKNGTSVNGAAATGQRLVNGDWLSFGGLPGRFERISEEAVGALDSERLARLHTSTELHRRLGAELEPLDLLFRFLESAIEVTRSERGFVLVAGPEGSLQPEVAAGFSPAEVRDEGFTGSIGAIERAIDTGASVVVQDLQADPVLGRRHSVIEKGLGALACVPLRREGQLMGLLYVDSRKPGSRFTSLDLEILETLADHTALLIAALQLERRIQDLIEQTARPARDPLVLAELRRRVAEVLRVPTGGPTHGPVC